MAFFISVDHEIPNPVPAIGAAHHDHQNVAQLAILYHLFLRQRDRHARRSKRRLVVFNIAEAQIFKGLFHITGVIAVDAAIDRLRQRRAQSGERLLIGGRSADEVLRKIHIEIRFAVDDDRFSGKIHACGRTAIDIARVLRLLHADGAARSHAAAQPEGYAFRLFRYIQRPYGIAVIRNACTDGQRFFRADRPFLKAEAIRKGKLYLARLFRPNAYLQCKV